MTLRRAGDGIEVALVTGACSGIGLAFARILARLGYALVLVSNREAELATVAAELAAQTRVETIALDLARPEAAEALVARLEAGGIEVDILINNAGVFFFGEVADADPRRAQALLQLHVVTPSLLCTLVGRRMRARGRGHVLLVSSISAWRAFPGIGYYASSKRYLMSFAEALRSELGLHGVGVTCLAPGATLTGLYDPNVVPVERARRLGVMMDAEVVAEAGLRAMFRGEAVCVPGVMNRVFTALAAATPQPAIDWLRRRAPWLKRRGGQE